MSVILAYVSNTYSGIFDCTITTTCDCGWSISVSELLDFNFINKIIQI